MASHNDYQLALRIPSDLLAAIDAEVERVKLERPGARVQRSDVVREALMRAFFHHPEKGSSIIKRDREDESGAAAAVSVARPNGNGRQHGAATDGDDSMKSH
jgi:Arc/MetJ-type ribon-helix-helix transcriptional regulator